MKSNGRLHLQRNIRPAVVGSDGPMKRLGVDLHNQIGFKGHKYDVRSSSFESSGKVLPWTGSEVDIESRFDSKTKFSEIEKG
ncbi:hypothetical protein ACI65C_003402 [Semiaphis heraclei]